MKTFPKPLSEEEAYYMKKSRAGNIFPSKTFSGIGKVGDIIVSCIEPLSQVMFYLGYEHDENDVHDVMLLCETFPIAIPDEYKEKYNFSNAH